jgi:putative ABC transport system substrate-binding protein
MNDEPTQQQNIAQLVGRLSNEMKTAAGFRSRPTPSPLTLLLSRQTRRREFTAGLVGAAAWPLTARAQQPAMPVVGFLFPSTCKEVGRYIAGLTAGLAEIGYVEGRSVALEYRAAEDHYERLPALANELVRRRVAVIFTAGNAPPALAAKVTTQTIPIVFMVGNDPVRTGLVASLARPGGNITGVTVFAGEVTLKRLAQLHELVPAATTVALLYSSANTFTTPELFNATIEAASRLGVRLLILPAANLSEIERAFAILNEQRAGALLVAADTSFTAQRAQIVALAARYRVPASYSRREFIEAGGLMSYGNNFGDAYRLAGVYVGRILNGEKPGDLPVQQPTKFELVFNLKTARTLGLTIPPNLLAIADEVIDE